MKTVAIIQARLGSTRLPMKSLLTLRGHALIDWVVERVARASLLDEVVVACPDTERDLVLAEHLERRHVRVVPGSEQDVLDRFAKAATAVNAGRIVRVCADNPLIWGEALDRLVREYDRGGCDYCYNHIPRGNRWPDGLGAEIVSRELLDGIAAKACEPSQREHCLNYIWDNQARFGIRTFDPEEPWLCRPDIKLDIDTLCRRGEQILATTAAGSGARPLPAAQRKDAHARSTGKISAGREGRLVRRHV